MEILDEGIISKKDSMTEEGMCIISDVKEIIIEKETEIMEKEPAKLHDFIPNLDVCFMLDCTGSMQSYIDRAKNKIKDIIEEVKLQYPGTEIYIGFVGYRDFDTPEFDILPFTPNLEYARDFIDKVRARGGADCPEDVNGGFQKALFNLEWQSQAKMIVHIADAPCHGRDFHSTGDTYPNGHVDDKPWNVIFKEIVDKHMDYLFLKIGTVTDKMFSKFKEIAESQGAAEKGILFKQEPISNIEQAASTGLGGGLFAPIVSTTATSLVPTTFKPPRKVGKKEKAVVKEKKPRAARSTSKKAAPKAKKEKTTKVVHKSEVEDSDDDEVVVDKAWVEPKYWTRSKAKEWKERQDTLKGKKSPKSKSRKTEKKEDDEEEVEIVSGSGYWKVSTRTRTPAKEVSSPAKSSRKKSVAKERERSEARDKRDDEAPKKRGRKPKSDKSVEKSTKKKVMKAPPSKALRKAPSFDTPMMAGMSAMDEAEYFAKLMTKEMKDSIQRKMDGMK